MKNFITWSVNHPDSTHGYSVTISQTYSSFDEREIRIVVDYLKNKVGTGLTLEYGPEEVNTNETKILFE